MLSPNTHYSISPTIEQSYYLGELVFTQQCFSSGSLTSGPFSSRSN
jgi:hypothetical protein